MYCFIAYYANKISANDGGPDGGKEKSGDPEWPSVIRIMSYILVFWLLVVFFGLIIVPPIFIIIFLVVEARVRIRYSVGSALIACTALLSGLFFLKVEIWLGVIDEAIPGILGGSILPDI